MAHRNKAPYRSQDPQETKELIQSLDAHAKKGKGKGGFSVKKNNYRLPDGRTIASWKMQDWDYKKPNLPTYARGLFTYVNDRGEHEIAVRGYDKFFNHGEVRKTEWMNVEKNTRGPYELSVKENGCIIFISGLDDGSLIVCSKHSTGERDNVDVSHAKAGEQWVDRHLNAVGKSREDLALTLRDMNATAVAELCDDEFEEHVLAYTPDSAGLYLHGININVPEFMTYPGNLVDKFAEEWGFRKTMYVMEDDIHEVKSFLDGIAETGAFNGRDTEGFVIRCQARETESAPWEDWFFKYKFEEPYLMYRQWRECTKAIISGKEPRYKKHKRITEDYLLYVRRCFAKDPGLAKKYNQNHGIIALRDAFLKERGLKGADIIRQELEAGDEIDAKAVTQNVILVPVATIGCGKTTVAFSLAKLFNWNHVQNDNIQGKQRRPQRFAQAVLDSLLDSPVTIADRNNHQKRERDQVINDILKMKPEARFVALQYVHEAENYDKIRQATRDRVLNRGDNHQTIHAGSKSRDEIIEIMEGFMYRFQPIDISDAPDDGFDLVIDLDVCATSRENLETIVSKLSSEFPKLFLGSPMPSADDLDAAIDAAMNEYRPDLKHDLSRPKDKRKDRRGNTPQVWRGDAATASQDKKSKEPKKPPQLEFFAIRLPAPRITSILDSTFRDLSPKDAKFYRTLQALRRVQGEFHVTLIHRAQATQKADIWEEYSAVHEREFERALKTWVPTPTGQSKWPEPELGKCDVLLERLLWDDRIMCFVVRIINVDRGEDAHGSKDVGGEANGANTEHHIQWQTTNRVAHVTVGTASTNIKPVQSNILAAEWLERGSGGDTGIQELKIKGSVVLSGSVRGVLQRF